MDPPIVRRRSSAKSRFPVFGSSSSQNPALASGDCGCNLVPHFRRIGKSTRMRDSIEAAERLRSISTIYRLIDFCDLYRVQSTVLVESSESMRICAVLGQLYI